MIDEPVSFSERARAILDEYLRDGVDSLTPEIWSEEDLKVVKAEIKAHHREKQNHRCSYCMRERLENHGMVWDIDHIVPKGTHVHFLFEAKNFCITCKECNQAKDDQNVLVNRSRKTYPQDSAAFLIVHPHLDDYQDHIRIFGGLLFYSTTDKGVFTKNVCNLDRFMAEKGGWEGAAGKIDRVLREAETLLDFELNDNEKIVCSINREDGQVDKITYSIEKGRNP